MTASAKLMEALARVEHKLDLLLGSENPTRSRYYPKVDDSGNKCPVCRDLIVHNVDIEDAVVVRKCGCSTGKLALDMRAFAPPALPAKRTDNGRRDDEEDRSDSSRTDRKPGRR